MSNGLLPPQYPWDEGDRLYASALNAAIANSPYLVNTGILNVLDFKAKGDGIHDDTEAINEAIATGQTVFFPSGTYLVTDALNLTTMGQIIYGNGSANTIISVPATFNMAARGVFNVEANAGISSPATLSTPGPTISDLTIEFAQVDTNVKANLIQFPPAIYITNTYRWRVQRVQLMRGWNGVYVYADNTAGSVAGGYIDDLRTGCLNINVYVDGSTDTMRLNNIHFWPFGCTPNQGQIFQSTTPLTTGLVIGRADDYHVSNMLCFVGLGISLIETANGSSYGTITSVDFDSFNGVSVTSGHCTLTNCLFLVGSNCIGLALLGNAKVTASGVSFACQSPSAQGITCFPSSGTTAELVMTGFDIGIDRNISGNALNVNSNASPGTSIVTLAGGQFQANTTITRPVAIILCQSNSVSLTMAGCQINPVNPSDPGGDFLVINGTGTNHRITGNISSGWNMVLPAGLWSYLEVYQQEGGASDLNTWPKPYQGFGMRNYLETTSQANWPPHTGPHISILDLYTANTSFRSQLTFGFETDGLWCRWQTAGTWNNWYQLVTTYGGMRMHGNLDFDNNAGPRMFNTAGTGVVNMIVGPDNNLYLSGIDASGSGGRNIARMLQNSNTSPFIFGVDVQFQGAVGFNLAAPLARPTVTGAKGGNAALASLLIALAAYGLVTDSTS